MYKPILEKADKAIKDVAKENKYDYIFTHDRRLIEMNPNKFLFVIPASWRKHFPDEHVSFYENKENEALIVRNEKEIKWRFQ